MTKENYNYLQSLQNKPNKILPFTLRIKVKAKVQGEIKAKKTKNYLLREFKELFVGSNLLNLEQKKRLRIGGAK